MGFSLLSIEKEMAAIQSEIRAEESAYKKYLLDLSLPINEPKFLFSIGGVNTIPEGELIGLKGRAKQGKSQFEYILIAVMLAGVEKCGIKPLLSNYKTLLFDTEQSKVSLKKCCQRAFRCAGMQTNKNSDMFQPYSLRPLSIEERKITIENAIKEEKPDIVFIDGVRDLLQDFNNLEQSSELIQWLLSLTATYGCTIVSVLHQNKSKEDGNMRGHLGTELLNKLTDCFEVSKKDGKFLVTCTDSRNVPCKDVAFSINAEGNFQEEATENKEKSADRATETLRVLGLCFREKSQLKYGELINAYQLEGCVSERTAKDRVKEAKQHDAILVQNGLYSLAPQ